MKYPTFISEGAEKRNSFVGLPGLDAFIQGKINQAIEEREARIVELDYFKKTIGGPYTPKKLGKYEAANVNTIKRVMVDAPDECADIIAALIFFSCLTGERERMAWARVAEQDARIEELEAALKPFAEAGEGIDDDEGRDLWEAPCTTLLTVADLLRARSATKRGE